MRQPRKISMVLFIFISFQSCAAGIKFLVAGIVGVCTRNSKSIVGPIITAVLYVIGALFTIGSGDTYPDLPYWGGLSAIFAVVFIVCVIKTKLNAKKKEDI